MVWILTCTLHAFGSASSQPKPGDRFELICVEGPPASADAPEHWQAIAEAGFTLLTPGYPYDEAWQKTSLGRCAEFGLRAVPRVKVFESGALPADWGKRVKQAVTAYGDDPAMYGYFVIDEPHADVFESIGRVNRAFAAADPVHVPCVNLFPTYASQAQLGTENYAEYLECFIKAVNPAVLSYDNYPFLKNGTDRRGFKDFFLNLEYMRKASIVHDIPVWLIGQADWWSGLREASEAELRVQAYSALAYGCKGIGYFTYWPVNRPYAAAVDYQGRRQPLYEAIKRVNLSVKPLGDMLVRMRTLGVYHTGLDIPDGCQPIPKTAPLAVEEDVSLVLGFFADKTGHAYVMLVNRDYTKSVRFSMRLGWGQQGISKVRNEKVEQTLELDDGKGTIALAPGAGALLRLERHQPTK